LKKVKTEEAGERGKWVETPSETEEGNGAAEEQNVLYSRGDKDPNQIH